MRVRLTSAPRIFALLSTVLALAAFGLLWFGPSGEMCTSTASGAESCSATSVAGSIAPGTLAFVLALSLVFSLVPLLARRAWVQYAWAGLIVVFYFVSFGVDLALLPAAAAAALGASLRR